MSDDLFAELFRIGSRGGGAFPSPGDLFESVIADIYSCVLSAGDVALDGGAHIGRHTFPMAAHVGADGVVLAVEPLPRLARRLVKKSREQHLSQVRVIAQALYRHAGPIAFHSVQNHSAYSGIEARRYDFNDKVRIIDVEATTIDALLSVQAGRGLRFCKLDLEGGELRALQGGMATLKAHRPLILFENDQENSARDYRYTKEEWFDFFASLDYDVFTLWGRPYRPEDWGRGDIPWYFIAAPAASRDTDFVRHRLPDLLRRYI